MDFEAAQRQLLTAISDLLGRLTTSALPLKALPSAGIGALVRPAGADDDRKEF
jgi:hypothetical protein